MLRKLIRNLRSISKELGYLVFRMAVLRVNMTGVWPRAAIGALFLLLALFAAACGLQQAEAATGFRPLDEAAIPVRAPASGFLIGIAKAGPRLVAAGDEGLIIYSDDEGKTWRQASVPVSVEITALGFASPEMGWAVGQYGVILHTQDGGATWQTQLTGIQANQLTLAAANLAISDHDPAPGAPFAQRRAQHFLDGGPDNPFLTIWTPSVNEAIAFGAYRMAMKTTDGGKTWTDWSLHVDDAYSHNLYGVADAAGAIYVVGETGLVFRSTDGGNSFQNITSPASTTLFGALGLGGNGVFVYGFTGQAYRSDDSGQTWTSVAMGASANITSAITLSNGWIVAGDENGNLYVSRDIAKSFVRAGVSASMAVFDLAQANDGAIVVVGNAGVQRISLDALGTN
jgi:photosystem II stability/assembly factor-like uncharacterized protein